MTEPTPTSLQRLHRHIGRLLFCLALPLLHLLQGRQPRLRALVTNQDQQILLVRNWFGSQLWELPGGGKKQHESAESGLAREVLEETGVTIDPQTLAFIASHTVSRRFAPLQLDLYCTPSDFQTTSQRGLEIIEAAWLPLDDLPATCDDTVHYAIKSVSAILRNR